MLDDPDRGSSLGDPTPTRKASAQWLEMVDAQCRDWTFELPRINQGRTSKRHRYAYGFTGFAHQQPAGKPNTFGPGSDVFADKICILSFLFTPHPWPCLCSPPLGCLLDTGASS